MSNIAEAYTTLQEVHEETTVEVAYLKARLKDEKAKAARLEEALSEAQVEALYWKARFQDERARGKASPEQHRLPLGSAAS